MLISETATQRLRSLALRPSRSIHASTRASQATTLICRHDAEELQVGSAQPAGAYDDGAGELAADMHGKARCGRLIGGEEMAQSGGRIAVRRPRVETGKHLAEMAAVGGIERGGDQRRAAGQ